MCDCKTGLEPSEAHWAVKLVTGLITGALLYVVMFPDRGAR